MTTVQAASSATLNVVLAARRVVVLPVREVAVHAVDRREAAAIPLLATQVVVAVEPAAMTMITTRRAAVAVEAAGDSFCHKTDKTFKTLFFNMLGWQRLATACRCLTRQK